MPGMDGTGPRGLGPMTGGGRGFCNPYSAGAGSAYGGAFPERFGGPGMQPYGFPTSPEQELNFLKNQAQMLGQQLDQINARVEELEKNDQKT